jgi:hypothetical protein
MNTACRTLVILLGCTLGACLTPVQEQPPGPTSPSSGTAASGTSGSSGASGSTGAASSTGATSSGATSTGSSGASSSSGGSTGGLPPVGCDTLLADFCRLGQACQQFDANCAQVVAPGGTLACSAASAPACDATLQAALAAGDCSLFIGGNAAGAPACTAALAGTYYFLDSAQEGEACAGSSECIQRPDGGAVYCTSDGSCTGVCSAGALGQACVGGCLEGYCNSQQLCQPFDGPGAACNAGGSNCDPASTYCAWGSSGSGTCQPFLAEGQSCLSSGGCDPSRDFCAYQADGGAVCTHLLAAGSLCESIRFGGCQAGTYCVPVNGNLQCEPPAQLGEACTEDCGWSNCEAHLLCEQGTCQVNQSPTMASGLGQACSTLSSYPCAQGYCDSPDGGPGVCRPLPGLNQPCGAGSACDPALICGPDGLCQGASAAGGPCSANYPQPCRSGDYCSAGGTCLPMGHLGEACDTTAHMPVCIDGTCDSTGHCAPLLAPGAPCDFQAFQCSSSLNGCAIDYLSDGGVTWYCSDYGCTYPGDGGTNTYCQAQCH